MTAPAIELIDASSAEQLAEIRTLFAEYADSLAVDLGFQDFEQELQNLPGDYARPRGALLLVRVDHSSVRRGRCVPVLPSWPQEPPFS